MTSDIESSKRIDDADRKLRIGFDVLHHLQYFLIRTTWEVTVVRNKMLPFESLALSVNECDGAAGPIKILEGSSLAAAGLANDEDVGDWLLPVECWRKWRE